MTNTNIFEVATKQAFRFPFKGIISTEDLWQLPLTSLDSVFKSLNSELKQVQEESMLNTKSAHDKKLDRKIAIVKYIVGVKLEEADAKSKEKSNSEQKQKIMEILKSKQDESLQNMSEEELKAMLEDM